MNFNSFFPLTIIIWFAFSDFLLAESTKESSPELLIQDTNFTAMDLNIDGYVPDDEMLPFDEWRKMELAKAREATKPRPVSRKNNYASMDCGAKLVAANKESQGSAAYLLTGKKDQYMITFCEADIWFVLELCSTVQIAQIELGNFELFSSSIKEFVVFQSNDFPIRDWKLLGHFTASPYRGLQAFTIESEDFAKFIKIEVASHYRDEHFCTLNVVNVFGTSMMDEFIQSDSHQEDPWESMDEEGVADTGDRPPKKSMFHLAKEAVKGMVARIFPGKSGSAPIAEISQNDALKQSNQTTGNQTSAPSCPNYSTHKKFKMLLLHMITKAHQDANLETATSAVEVAFHSNHCNDSSDNDTSCEPENDLVKIDSDTSAKVNHLNKGSPANKDDSRKEQSTGAKSPSKPDQESHDIRKSPMHLIPLTQAPKDSPLVRLSNKLSHLEMNLTLSSVYLEELSRSYRTTMEQTNINFDTAFSAINETFLLTRAIDEEQQKELIKLQEQAKNLSENVRKLLNDQDNYSVKAMELHTYMLAVELIVLGSAFWAFLRWQFSSQHKSYQEPIVKADVTLTSLNVDKGTQVDGEEAKLETTKPTKKKKKKSKLNAKQLSCSNLDRVGLQGDLAPKTSHCSDVLHTQTSGLLFSPKKRHQPEKAPLASQPSHCLPSTHSSQSSLSGTSQACSTCPSTSFSLKKEKKFSFIKKKAKKVMQSFSHLKKRH